LRLASEKIPAPAPKALEPATPPAPAWSGSVGAGLIFLSGNSNSVTFSANASGERKTENWVFSAKANAAYGQSRPAGESAVVTLAQAAALQVRADRLLGSLAALYLATGAETDHIKSLELRALGEGGLGLRWLDVKEGDLQKVSLRTDVALRYARELRFQYYPVSENLADTYLVAPRFGLSFKFALTREVTFAEDAEVLPNLTGDSRVLVNSLSKLSTRLVGGLSLGIALLVQHDNKPSAGKMQTDTSLTFGLEMAL